MSRKKWIKPVFTVIILSFLFLTSFNTTSSAHTDIRPSRQEAPIFENVIKEEMSIQSSVNETAAYGPPLPIEVCWGWVGNLSFRYWDVTKDEGIPGANVTCHLWNPAPYYFDLGNGSYLVEVNTTYAWPLNMLDYLWVRFDKTGFVNQDFAVRIIVFPVPTSLEIFSPEVNQINENPYQLIVPLGNSIDFQFFYNDTEDSDGYVGGLEGAQTNARIVGPTLVEQYMEIANQGNGFYNLTFDTTSDWLYESVGGIPTAHELSYLIYVEFNLEYRLPGDFMLNITIIDIPTEFQITPALDNIVNDGQYSIFVSLVDIWPTHDGLPIQGLNITVESSDPTLLEIISVTEDSPEPGVYNITLYHRVPAGVDGGCTGILYAHVNLTIELEKDGFEGANEVLSIGLWSHTGLPVPPRPIYGLPISIIVIVGTVVYIEWKKRRSENLSVQPEVNAPSGPI